MNVAPRCVVDFLCSDKNVNVSELTRAAIANICLHLSPRIYRLYNFDIQTIGQEIVYTHHPLENNFCVTINVSFKWYLELLHFQRLYKQESQTEICLDDTKAVILINGCDRYIIEYIDPQFTVKISKALEEIYEAYR